MDFLMDRLERNPDLHIFHFAAYERTALARLMGRHATREDEVDRLLRGKVLVDLHRVVRQSLRASVESYSLKKLEPLYGFTRDVDLRDAGSSIAVFEQWLELGDGERPSADHLAADRALQPGRRRSAPRGCATGSSRCVPRRSSNRASRAAPGPGRARAGGGARGGAGGGGPAGGRASPRASPTTRPSGHPSSRRAGCWRSSCRGTGARRSRSGGRTTT